MRQTSAQKRTQEGSREHQEATMRQKTEKAAPKHGMSPMGSRSAGLGLGMATYAGPHHSIRGFAALSYGPDDHGGMRGGSGAGSGHGGGGPGGGGHGGGGGGGRHRRHSAVSYACKGPSSLLLHCYQGNTLPLAIFDGAVILGPLLGAPGINLLALNENL